MFDLMWIIPSVIGGLFALFIIYRTIYNLWRKWQTDSAELDRYQKETATIIQGRRYKQWKPDQNGFLGYAIDTQSGELVNLDLLDATGNPQTLSINERQRLLAALKGTSLKTAQELLGQSTPALPENFTPQIEPSIERHEQTIDL